MGFLSELTSWHWLILAVFLLSLEALGVGGFLLGMGIAAVVVCIMSLFVDSWQIELFTFAILSMIFSYLYWAKFRKFNEAREDTPLLNNRVANLIGQAATVVSKKTPTHVKVQIGDTLWEANSELPLLEGDSVVVISATGTTLNVEKSES